MTNRCPKNRISKITLIAIFSAFLIILIYNLHHDRYISTSAFTDQFDRYLHRRGNEPQIVASTNSGPVPSTPTDRFDQIISSELQPSLWHQVENRRLLIRSAYIDRLQSDEVRIMAVRHCKEFRPVECIFHSRYVKNYTVTVGSYHNVNSPTDKDCAEDKYESYYIYCQLPELRSDLAFLLPTHISIQASDENSAPSATPIQIAHIPKPDWEFASCISPLYDWNDEKRLILFLEYYIYHGVTQFLIYNYTSSDSVATVLNHYSDLGYVTVIQWSRIPNSATGDDPNRSIYYKGQILQYNDCLWRLRGRAKYVSTVDLDEFIVPLRTSDNLTTILDLIRANDEPLIGDFMFLMSHVYVDWPQTGMDWNSTSLNGIFNFTSLSAYKDHRIHPPEFLSKMIVKPRAIDKQTVHLVWKYHKDVYKRKLIDSSVAHMYHMKPLWKKQGRPVKIDTIFRDKLRAVFNFTDYS